MLCRRRQRSSPNKGHLVSNCFKSASIIPNIWNRTLPENPEMKNLVPILAKIWGLILTQKIINIMKFTYEEFKITLRKWIQALPGMGGCPGTMSRSRFRPANTHDRNRDSKPRDSWDGDKNLRNSPAIKIPRDNESWYFGTGTKNRGTVPSRPLPISGPGTSWKFEISVKMLKVFETFLKKVPILANFPYKSSICRLGSVIKRVIKMRGQFEVKSGHLWLSRFCHFRRFSHFSWFNALKRVRFTPFHSFWHYRRSLGDVGKN